MMRRDLFAIAMLTAVLLLALALTVAHADSRAYVDGPDSPVWDKAYVGLLDGNGDIVIATDNHLVINRNWLIQTAAVEGAPNPTGKRVRWDYANTGIEWAIHADMDRDGVRDTYYFTRDWSETVSANGVCVAVARYRR
jgi:hypothetical protein